MIQSHGLVKATLVKVLLDAMAALKYTCHINGGTHGTEQGDHAGDDPRSGMYYGEASFSQEDLSSIANSESSFSFHQICSAAPPIYPVVNFTINGFCYSDMKGRVQPGRMIVDLDTVKDLTEPGELVVPMDVVSERCISSLKSVDFKVCWKILYLQEAKKGRVHVGLVQELAGLVGAHWRIRAIDGGHRFVIQSHTPVSAKVVKIVVDAIAAVNFTCHINGGTRGTADGHHAGDGPEHEQQFGEAEISKEGLDAMKVRFTSFHRIGSNSVPRYPAMNFTINAWDYSDMQGRVQVGYITMGDVSEKEFTEPGEEIEPVYERSCTFNPDDFNFAELDRAKGFSAADGTATAVGIGGTAAAVVGAVPVYTAYSAMWAAAVTMSSFPATAAAGTSAAAMSASSAASAAAVASYSTAVAGTTAAALAGPITIAAAGTVFAVGAAGYGIRRACQPSAREQTQTKKK